jgi:hypothetical protein
LSITLIVIYQDHRYPFLVIQNASSILIPHPGFSSPSISLFGVLSHHSRSVLGICIHFSMWHCLFSIMDRCCLNRTSLWIHVDLWQMRINLEFIFNID